jgi:hypothetical protein
MNRKVLLSVRNYVQRDRVDAGQGNAGERPPSGTPPAVSSWETAPKPPEFIA